MKFWKFAVLSAFLGAFFLLLLPSDAGATLKYKKETGKKCSFCHTSVPEPGDEDPKLTEEGRNFVKNGYKLTEEQKKLPPRD